MSRRVTVIMLWVISITLGLSLEHGRAEFASWLVSILPSTAVNVLLQFWPAAVLTTLASLTAFVAAIGIGYAAGLTASVAELAATNRHNPRHPKIARFISELVSRSYYLMYLLPFVLTVTLTRNVTASRTPPFQALAMIVMSGAALGGYQLFSSFYNAATVAPAANRALVDSLQPNAFCLGLLTRSGNRKLKLLGSAYRLRDCQIQSHCDAIERAWHLSIVAVMIVESLIHSFYESFWSSPGIVHEFTSGLGGLVMTTNGLLPTKTLVGCIWLVLCVDWIGLALIKNVCRKRWLIHYEQT